MWVLGLFAAKLMAPPIARSSGLSPGAAYLVLIALASFASALTGWRHAPPGTSTVGKLRRAMLATFVMTGLVAVLQAVTGYPFRAP